MKRLPVFILIPALIFGGSCNSQPATPVKGTVRAGNLEVYYERKGKGNAILLLHAGLPDHTMWKEQVNALSGQYEYRTTLANLRLHKMAGWPTLQNHPPAIERLSLVTVPVLIINGDKDLPYIITTSEYLEKNIPGARRIVIKGVAHMLNMEKPSELNNLVLDFLKN